jgi:hypothetical protein
MPALQTLHQVVPFPQRHAPRGHKPKRKRPFPLHQRRRDLARLVVRRHNRLPRDCWTYIKVAAWHCPCGPNRRDALMHWFELVCAPVSIRRQVDDILERVPPRRISADALGKLLNVTEAERTALHIYTIGTPEVPKAVRTKRRKEKRRLAEQARRRANGSKPREQSFSRTKPWEAFRIKRRAWERRGKPTSATTQIRGQDSFYSHGHALASCVAARAESVPNRNGKSNGTHGARRRRRLPTKERTSEQRHPAATPRPSQVVHLEAVGIG